MQEQLIDFATTKLANDKGCDIIRCMCGGFPNCICTNKSLITQSLLQKWLREEHNLEVLIMYWNKKWVNAVYKIGNDKSFSTGLYEGKKGTKIYEDALEKGLIEALKLI